MPSNWDDMVLVGRIARAHGNRGEVIVDPATDFAEERFTPGAEFHARRDGAIHLLRVTAARFHQGRPVVALENVATIGDAERWAHVELRIPAEALRRLPDGTYYEHDLAGCRVETDAGLDVGVVRELGGGAGSRWLVIDGPGGEVLVPFAAEICVAIDIVQRRIVIRAPEGLLEANRKEGRGGRGGAAGL